MIFHLYAIKDELSEYASPITIETEAQAKRYFRQMVENTKMMADNPEDFSIWEVGKFDTENGTITSALPKLIERARSTRNE